MRTNESIERLDAAVRALGDVDLADWSDATLRGHLEELSAVLCRVDGQLARLADAVRARGFRVEEKPEERTAVTLAA
ncbi:MAG TPA: hypothetical protein VGJ07_26780 [Rugosimonospora sp.]|jgi:hypothetical protein